MGILPLTPPTASVAVCGCISGVRRCCSLTRRPPRSSPQLPLRIRWWFVERNEFGLEPAFLPSAPTSHPLASSPADCSVPLLVEKQHGAFSSSNSRAPGRSSQSSSPQLAMSVVSSQPAARNGVSPDSQGQDGGQVFAV